MNDPVNSRVRRLPVVEFLSSEDKGKRFFVDARLSELRNVENPHERFEIELLEDVEYRFLEETAGDGQ